MSGARGGMGGRNGMGGMGGMGAFMPQGGSGTMALPLAALPPPDKADQPWPNPESGLPTTNLKLDFDGVAAPGYTLKTWHPTFIAQAVLAEFAATTWPALASAYIKVHDQIESAHTIDQEIRILLYLAAAERPARIGEIIAQAEDARPYWAFLLGGNPVAIPFTWALVEIGMAVGQMTGMYFKKHYNRPRPSHYYPGLITPIPTPGHPSYPNNHALQSLLASRCVSLVFEQKNADGSFKSTRPGLTEPLKALAIRVGQNREVAGVHFPSDREASKSICAAIMESLPDCPTFDMVLKEAKKEW